jgi:hypothetical protein
MAKHAHLQVKLVGLHLAPNSLLEAFSPHLSHNHALILPAPVAVRNKVQDPPVHYEDLDWLKAS